MSAYDPKRTSNTPASSGAGADCYYGVSEPRRRFPSSDDGIALRANAVAGVVDERALADCSPFLAGFVPDFLQFLFGENVTDLEIGVRARRAYALIEPADMRYSSKSFLTQFSGVRPAFESYASNFATHQFRIRK
jgi:hypothetical protein